jgi:hypothetical protein
VFTERREVVGWRREVLQSEREDRGSQLTLMNGKLPSAARRLRLRLVRWHEIGKIRLNLRYVAMIVYTDLATPPRDGPGMI